MHSITKVFVSVAAVLAGIAVVMAAIGILWFYSMSSTVMTKRSPDGKHVAVLGRIDGIDLIFNLSVDGKHVYQSPDFAPTSADCREQIVWASDRHAVVLLVAETRLFGYNLNERRASTDSELAAIRFPGIAELGFEGTIPNTTAVR